MTPLLVRIVLFTALLHSGAAATTVSFQQGSNGYGGAVDTFLQEDPTNSNTDNGLATALNWDDDDPPSSGTDAYVLARFDGIIGNGAGQVPAGEQITEATLYLTVFNTGNSGQVHDVLIPWNQSDTYTSFCGAGCSEGVQHGPLVAPASGGSAVEIAITVTASVQAWADGTANNGWIVRPEPGGTNGVDVRSSEYATVAQRPRLVVRYGEGGPTVGLVRQPYLQLASPTSITVVWRTENATDSQVSFGTTLGDLGQVVTDATVDTDHFVQIDGLDPATKYFYEVGSTAGVQAGGDADHYFTTPPLHGTPASLRAWIVGDSGTGGTAQANVRDAMLGFVGNDLPDIYVHLGDIAYDNGTDSEFTLNHFAPYANILRHTPIWTTIGNHEAASSDSPTESGPYYEAFVLPRGGEAGGEPSGTEAYYSFNYGNIHFICLDSHDTPRAPGSTMLNWLQDDLAGTDQDWIVAFWHHPPYTKGSHNSDSAGDSGGRLVDMRENVLPILEAGGVDLVLGGHSHIYERSYLIDGAHGYGSAPNFATPGFATLLANGDILDSGAGQPYLKRQGLTAFDGAVYVVAGHGGRGVSQQGVHPVMFFSESANGSCILDIQGDTLSLTNIRQDGVVTDSFSIVKVECVDDADCDDDAFCNGGETCDANGDCQAGPDPCPGQNCNEAGDSCTECSNDPDCDDGLFCNGIETCDGNGSCVFGTDPCDPLLCSENDDSCVECLSDGDCDDGSFCSGIEFCDANGSCQTGSDPCPGQLCDEGGDLCADCLLDSGCDDGSFCNGAEACLAGSCQAGSDPCPGQLCDEGGDLCADCLLDSDCDDGSFCNGAEACLAGSCQAGSDPCPGQLCDEGGDLCADCLLDSDCDDGSFCNGAEACLAGSCQTGSDPCPGQLCDEGGDVCADPAQPQMEVGTVIAGETPVTVTLQNTYASAVVVATVHYANNAAPVVARVGNVTSSSFDVRLQNPGGGTVAADQISYLVMEEGVWTIDGVSCEAQKYTSTVTDENNSWVGEAQSYGQAYTSPVVVGQVMSENDPRFSTFWAQGTSRTSPPSAGALRTGKTVSEDTDVARLDEEIGFIVFEASQGTIGGIAFETLVGADSVSGVSQTPPYSYDFSVPFGSAPVIAVASLAGMDGGNGGWAQVHGSPGTTESTLLLSVDEDQIGDSERNHTTEQVAYVAFEGAAVYPPQPDCSMDGDCDDGAFCNGAESCQTGACQAGADPCPGELCDEPTDTCVSPPATNELWVSFKGTTAIPSVGNVQDEDITAYDVNAGTWSVVFDGSDVGLSGLDLAGFAKLPSGDILMTFTAAASIPGLVGGPDGGTAVDDSDIVRFAPTSLGADTTGTFHFHFDGSDVGLTGSGEDLDGILLASDGRIIVSTRGSFSGTGASGADEDLFLFSDTALGESTAGSFEQYFDGSDVGLSGGGGEDIDAVARTSGGSLLFSTVGSFAVTGLSGQDEDVAEFQPSSLGSSTAGSYALFQSLTALGIDASEDVDGLAILAGD